MGGPFSLDDGFVAAASSNVEIGGKGSASSSTWTWVNQLATLFNDWDDAGPPSSTAWSYLGHLFAGIAMSSWRSIERHEDLPFWKRSVSPSFLGAFLVVLFWVVFVFGAGFFFRLWKTPGFLLLTVLEQCENNSWSKTIRFDDRQSLSVQGMSSKKSTFYKKWLAPNGPSRWWYWPHRLVLVGLFCAVPSFSGSDDLAGSLDWIVLELLLIVKWMESTRLCFL